MLVHRGASGAGRTRPRTRLLTGLLAAIALLTAAAPAVSPAHADEAGGLVLTVPSTLKVTQGTPLNGKRQNLLRVEVGRSGGGALKKARITVDALGAWATAPGSGQRAVSLHGWTLPLGDSDGPITRALLLDVPSVGGVHNTVHVTASAEGLAPVTRDVVLEAADSGPALRLAGIDPATAEPGAALTPRPAFENSGDAPAQKVVLTFSTVYGLAPAETFSNCEYAAFPEDEPPTDGRPDAQHAICTFDRTVRVGEAYVVTPFVLNATDAVDSTWATFAVGAEEGAEAANWRSRHRFQQGTGRPLGLERIDGLRQEGLNPAQTYRVTGGQADVTVEASWKPTSPDGLAGHLTVTFRNSGPVPFADDPDDRSREHSVRVFPPSTVSGGGSSEVPERPDTCVPVAVTELSPVSGTTSCTFPRFIEAGGEYGFTLPVILSEGALGQPARFSLPSHPSLALGAEPATTGPVPLYPPQQASQPSPAPPAAGAPPAAAPPVADAAPAPAHHVRLRWKAAGFLVVLGAVGALLLVARRHRRAGQQQP
ncbi:hypothetical protein GCM10018790_69420 [Kitasatospora xanthocidica]|uniref:hypothetical protein n=1 Tax=Kitasatospora xanthocidica TaxID=83382 RepID=UPI0016787CE2|nr:hypothetical protein [Kitasatospora xanthocidica]GHF81873.1 hypothetical protein GCM10018790_69420 [Kitasatospora xanthocidica]